MKSIAFLSFFWVLYINQLAAQDLQKLSITLGANGAAVWSANPDVSKDLEITLNPPSGCTTPKLFTVDAQNVELEVALKSEETPLVFTLAKGQDFKKFKITCGDKIYITKEIESSKDKTLTGYTTSRPTVDGNDSIRLEFLGNGDIQKSYKEGAPLQANTGLGVSFQRLWHKKDSQGFDLKLVQDLSLDFVINVASTADSTVAKLDENNLLQNRRDFGTYLLIPVNSRQAAYLDFNLYFSNHRKGTWTNVLFGIINGINIRFAGSNNTWVYKDANSTVTIDATGIMFRGGFFYDFIPDNIRRKNNYSITVGANYSFRGLYGDISSEEDAMKNYRMALLGTEQKRWHGVEFNLGIRFKNIRAEVQIPIFKAKENGVKGLTDTQFVTSIRFVGGFPLGL